MLRGNSIILLQPSKLWASNHALWINRNVSSCFSPVAWVFWFLLYLADLMGKRWATWNLNSFLFLLLFFPPRVLCILLKHEWELSCICRNYIVLTPFAKMHPHQTLVPHWFDVYIITWMDTYGLLSSTSLIQEGGLGLILMEVENSQASFYVIFELVRIYWSPFPELWTRVLDLS